MVKTYECGFEVLETMEEVEAFRREQEEERRNGDDYSGESYSEPLWRNEECLKPLLILNDETERAFAENVLRIRGQMISYQRRLKIYDCADHTKRALRQAHLLVKLYIKAVKILERYSNKGTQPVVVLQSPAVGLNEKIIRKLTPLLNAQQIELLHQIDYQSSCYNGQAHLFERVADRVRAQMENICDIDRARICGLTVPCHDEALKWEDLSTKCLGIASELLETKISLIRRPQLVLKEYRTEVSGTAANSSERGGEASNVH